MMRRWNPSGSDSSLDLSSSVTDSIQDGTVPQSYGVFTKGKSLSAIVRTVEWALRCEAFEADRRLRTVMSELGMAVEGEPGAIRSSAKRALMRNRWAAEVAIDIVPTPSGCCATVRVDMLGNKHFEIVDEIAENLGEALIDDLGLSAAVARLGKLSKLFGRKEIRNLHNQLRRTETVMELGQGMFDNKQGIVVLTTERLFFFEKSFISSESVREFPMAAVSSISTEKRRTGETLTVTVSGNVAEIKNMMHGQSDAIARAFHTVKYAPPIPPSGSSGADDPIAQLERLSGLRDRGVLTEAEFLAKKEDLLRRL